MQGHFNKKIVLALGQTRSPILVLSSTSCGNLSVLLVKNLGVCELIYETGMRSVGKV